MYETGAGSRQAPIAAIPSRRLFYGRKRGVPLCSARGGRRTIESQSSTHAVGACIGVILGFAGASAEGPELVSLLFKPLQDSFSCSGSVNLALTQFVRLQLTCAVIGAGVALLAMFFWRRFFRRRAEAKQRTAV